MKNKGYILLLLPALLFLVVFLIVPIFRITIPSFFPEGGFSLKLYINFLSDSFYFKVFVRTVRISLITSLICAGIALPVSFYISRMSVSKKGMMIAFATFPLLTNTVVRAFAWIAILGRQGIINNFLTKLGVIAEPLKMLYTEGAIVVGSVYLFLPIMIISLVGVMENIRDDTLEAAQSLGSGRLITFLKIVVPLSMPGLIVGGVLVFAGTSSAYSTPLMLGGNKNMMMSTLIYQQAMVLSNWNMAAVIATIMIVSSYFIVGVLNKVADKISS